LSQAQHRTLQGKIRLYRHLPVLTLRSQCAGGYPATGTSLPAPGVAVALWTPAITARVPSARVLPARLLSAGLPPAGMPPARPARRCPVILVARRLVAAGLPALR